MCTTSCSPSDCTDALAGTSDTGGPAASAGGSASAGSRTGSRMLIDSGSRAGAGEHSCTVSSRPCGADALGRSCAWVACCSSPRASAAGSVSSAAAGPAGERRTGEVVVGARTGCSAAGGLDSTGRGAGADWGAGAEAGLAGLEDQKENIARIRGRERAGGEREPRESCSPPGQRSYIRAMWDVAGCVSWRGVGGGGERWFESCCPPGTMVSQWL